MQIDQSFVDPCRQQSLSVASPLFASNGHVSVPTDLPHFESIPCVGALSAGRLPCGDAQRLGRNPNGSLDAQVLVLGSRDQLRAHWVFTDDVVDL